MAAQYRTNTGWVIDLRRLHPDDRTATLVRFPDPTTPAAIEWVTKMNRDYFARGRDIINTAASIGGR